MMSESAIHPYPEHWELTTLGQLCSETGGGIQTGPFGSQLHASDYVDVGIPSIMPKNISIEEISTEDIARITDDDARRLSKYLVKEGDIVYSRRGDVEKCSLVTKKEAGWLCGTGCLKVSLGSNSRVTPSYIHAYLSSPSIREWISRHAIGATMPNLNTSILSDVPVLIPSEKEINVIENIWRSITDKIILNRQTNQTLEHIAQAIFKSWFVDFEPTRAKIAAKQIAQARQDSERSAALKAALFADGRWPEAVAAAIAEGDPERAAMAAISGKTLGEIDQLDVQGRTNAAGAGSAGAASPEQQAQLLTTAALFPDALVDSELGEIPEGWSINFLYDVAEIVYGKNLPTKDLLEYGYPVFGGNGVIGFHERYLYEDPMTLVSCRGAASGKVLRSLPKSFVTNNSLVIDHGKKGYLTQYYLEPCLNRYGLTELTSGSAQPQMTIANMSPVQLVVPTKEIINNHKDLVGPLFNKILQQETEVKRLESLRDTLLPKLLSGELDIRANQTELDKTA